MDTIFDKLYFSFTGQKLEADDVLQTPEALYKAEILFTILQRKEEYNSSHFDSKGRFSPENASLFLSGKSQEPIVDQYFDEIFPKSYPNQYAYTCIPTFDIDNAFAFKGKGLWKNVGGLGKNIFTDYNRAKSRIQTWFGKSDPYDTYAYLVETCRSFGMKPLFFIQMGSYGNGFDTNIDFTKKEGKALLRYLGEQGEIGLHPSYASNTDKTLLYKEYQTLCDIVGKKITKSRQHFVMLHFPKTYRNLIELGIEEDYSMGWTSQLGFRAGTSRPFYWYDLENENFTHLKIFPFPCMDGTLHEYLNLPVNEAVEHADYLIQQTKKHHGVFTPLWHNHSINNQWEWKSWQSVFEQMLALACP